MRLPLNHQDRSQSYHSLMAIIPEHQSNQLYCLPPDKLALIGQLPIKVTSKVTLTRDDATIDLSNPDDYFDHILESLDHLEPMAKFYRGWQHFIHWFMTAEDLNHDHQETPVNTSELTNKRIEIQRLFPELTGYKLAVLKGEFAIKISPSTQKLLVTLHMEEITFAQDGQPNTPMFTPPLDMTLLWFRHLIFLFQSTFDNPKLSSFYLVAGQPTSQATIHHIWGDTRVLWHYMGLDRTMDPLSYEYDQPQFYQKIIQRIQFFLGESGTENPLVLLGGDYDGSLGALLAQVGYRVTVFCAHNKHEDRIKHIYHSVTGDEELTDMARIISVPQGRQVKHHASHSQTNQTLRLLAENHLDDLIQHIEFCDYKGKKLGILSKDRPKDSGHSASYLNSPAMIVMTAFEVPSLVEFTAQLRQLFQLAGLLESSEKEDKEKNKVNDKPLLVTVLSHQQILCQEHGKSFVRCLHDFGYQLRQVERYTCEGWISRNVDRVWATDLAPKAGAPKTSHQDQGQQEVRGECNELSYYILVSV
ncbi:MAG: hypothetical protein OXC40_04885 [Proteobacteria bacterium]|nr:hypothetical protein [Pseudomonadota bacterium]